MRVPVVLITGLALLGGASMAEPVARPAPVPVDGRGVPCPPPKVVVSGRCQVTARSKPSRGAATVAPHGPAGLSTNECIALGGTVSNSSTCASDVLCTTSGGSQCVTEVS